MNHPIIWIWIISLIEYRLYKSANQNPVYIWQKHIYRDWFKYQSKVIRTKNKSYQCHDSPKSCCSVFYAHMCNTSLWLLHYCLNFTKIYLITNIKKTLKSGWIVISLKQCLYKIWKLSNHKLLEKVAIHSKQWIQAENWILSKRILFWMLEIQIWNFILFRCKHWH